MLATLEQLGSAQTCKTYLRHGAKPPLFGVSYANFGALKKKLKTNHALALDLWRSGNLDARILAGMIADAAQADAALCEEWIATVDNRLTSCAAADLFARSPLASNLVQQWIASPEEWRSTTGWTVMSHLANAKIPGDDAFFLPFLAQIERTIHQAPNQTRYSMNNALIAIGVRNSTLQKKALAVAAKIGRVEVDHGDTDCKTPDAAAYIRKTAEYQARKAKAARK